MRNASRHAEFTELLAQHRSQLFGYIYALLRNLDDAEDVYQDTSLVLWSKFEEYAPGTHFFRWACVVARNRVAMFLKRKCRDRKYFSSAFQEELAAIQADIASSGLERFHQSLTDCMKKLPEPDRQLIAKCYGSSRAFKQVAEQLGRSAQSVYDSLCRIRRQLLECIDRMTARSEHPRTTEDRP
jgi:RNA polymerase sigma-70 factor, ECF subfamily